MSTNLSETKSLLAKLLAAENITVQHLNVKTASFNTVTRILTCPIWKDMTGDLYDLFMGHEIGHALYTPGLEYSEVSKKKGPKYQGFLNVCEDARIEKLVKRKYPGIRKPFIAGYNNLLERNFFGIKKLKNLSSLNLIDRINLSFKCGGSLIIKFNDKEKILIKELERAETFPEVLTVTQKIWDYVKEKEEDKINNEQDMQDVIEGKSKPQEGEEKGKPVKSKKKDDKKEDEDDDSDSDDSDDDSDSGDDSDNVGDSDDSDDDSNDSDGGTDSDSGDSDIDGSDDDSDESSDDSDSGSSEDSDDEASNGKDEEGEDLGGGLEGSQGGKDEPKLPQDPESITDQSFREKEDELVDPVARPYIYLDLPECDLKKTIIPNKTIVDFFEAAVRVAMRNSSARLDYDVVSSQLMSSFNKRNSKYIALLVKEFEMRKNAQQYSRQLESKTGELDMRKLARYKFSSDIFKKMTHTPKGKDHGMVMFVDMSISMISIIHNTMEQALILSTFCKKVGIPFEVYGFSDSPVVYMGDNKYKEEKFTAKTVTAFSPTSTYFHLKSLINSDLSARSFNRAATMMLIWSLTQYPNAMSREEKLIFKDYKLQSTSGNMTLSGTPFIETVVASRAVINAFKQKTHVDITNVIYLTDGEGGMSIRFPQIYNQYDLSNLNKFNLGFVDPVTKVRVLVKEAYGNQIQAALTRLVRLTTNCRHIGFYVGTKDALKQYAKMEKANMKEVEESISKNGFFKIERLGYDSYYYVEVGEAAITDVNFGDYKNAETSSEIATAFADIQRKKSTKRAMVTSFATEIASQSST